MYYFNDLLTPKSLCNKYPQTKFLNWTPSKVGTFMASSLLIGVPKNTKKPAQIREKSFSELIEYTKELNDFFDEDMRECDLYTPFELFEMKPRVELLNWTPSRIGMFLKNRLLIGIDKGLSRPSLIYLPSFTSLIERANKNLDKRKVYV